MNLTALTEQLHHKYTEGKFTTLLAFCLFLYNRNRLLTEARFKTHFTLSHLSEGILNFLFLKSIKHNILKSLHAHHVLRNKSINQAVTDT